MWPAGRFRRDHDLTRAIHARIDAVLDRIQAEALAHNLPKPFGTVLPLLKPVLLGMAPLILRRTLKRKAVESIDEAVRAVDQAA